MVADGAPLCSELLPHLAAALFGIPWPPTIDQILLVDSVPQAARAGSPRRCAGTGRHARGPRPSREKLLFASRYSTPIRTSAAEARWDEGRALPSEKPVHRRATTACLSAIIVSQIINVFLSKHPDRSWCRASLLNHRLIMNGAAIEIGLILLVDYVPIGQRIIGKAPHGLEVEVCGFLLMRAPVTVLGVTAGLAIPTPGLRIV